MNDSVKYDEPTLKWFEQHTDVQTTVCKCDSCGLFYKPSLGHKCKKGTIKDMYDFTVKGFKHTDNTKKILSEKAKKQNRKNGKFASNNPELLEEE